MRGVEYAELAAFLSVAEKGSFRRAADELVVSPSAISHTIRALEERLGIRLFHRTTRSLSLTKEGAMLRSRILPAFETIAFSVTEASRMAQTTSGTVRITAPRVASQMVLTRKLPEFLLRYPEIQVEVDINEHLIDSVAEGFDAGIRLGDVVRGDMEGIPISPQLCGIFVASPDYFERFPVPRKPEDLKEHRWLNLRYPSGRMMPWEFRQGSKEKVFSELGQLLTSDAELLIEAASRGCGIACVTAATVREHLTLGRLVQVLREWSQPYPGWHIYYPKGRLLPPALKLLCEHLREAD